MSCFSLTQLRDQEGRFRPRLAVFQIRAGLICKRSVKAPAQATARAVPSVAVPRKQFVNAPRRMIGNAGQHVGEVWWAPTIPRCGRQRALMTRHQRRAHLVEEIARRDPVGGFVARSAPVNCVNFRRARSRGRCSSATSSRLKSCILHLRLTRFACVVFRPRGDLRVSLPLVDLPRLPVPISASACNQ